MISSLRVFLIWLPVFFAVLLVSTTCLGRFFVKHDIQVAEHWFPNYSVTRLNKNESLISNPLTPQIAKQVKANAFEGLRRAPLSHRPFLHVGESNVILSERSENRDLFAITLKRNSRNRRALRALVNIDISQGKYISAIRNLDLLLSLKGEVADTEEYHRVLIYLSDRPDALRVIDEYISTGPKWGKKYLNNRIQQMGENNYLDVGRSLKLYTKEISDKKSMEQLNKYYLTSLKRMNKIDFAYDFWYGLIEVPKPDTPYTVFNPTFKKVNALPPFNWLEIEKVKYFSEIDQSGGLYASYADSEVRVISEQILMLEPGKVYRLDVDAEWTYRRRQGMFFWALSCIPNNQIISGVNLDKSAKEDSGGYHDFLVPPQDCKTQSLRLLAKSGQYAQRIWSRTNSVQITQLQ